MKVAGIIFIVIGILAIAFNAIAIPNVEFSQTGDDAYDTAYNVGLFLFAIVGVLLLIIGIFMYRSGVRKDREKIARMYDSQQQHPQPPPPQRYNTY